MLNWRSFRPVQDAICGVMVDVVAAKIATEKPPVGVPGLVP